MKLASIVGHVLELCEIVENNTTPVDKIAWSFFKERHYLGSRDRAKIRAAVFGMQRNWRYIQAVAKEFYSSHSHDQMLPSGKERFLPLFIAHAYMAAEQPFDEILKGLADVWGNHYPGVELSVYQQWLNEHAKDVGNSADIVERYGIKHSFPDWMVRRLYEQYSNETEALLQGLNKMARITLRVNLHKISRKECQQRLLNEGVATTPTEHSPAGLIAEKRYDRMASSAFKEGLYEFQDEGSQLVSLIAHPKPNELVIDACAGGGGKTLHLNEMMNDTGKIIAVDVDMIRMKGLDARIRRSAIHNIELQTNETLNRQELLGTADLVLVDAPCSGIGRIRRSPDIKWRLKESHVDLYPSKQKGILEQNADIVKQGGHLVYATCSLFKSENETVVLEFLSSRKEFILRQPVERMTELGLQSEPDGFIRILPHRYPTDGFFIAVMEKTG
ncbi:MAG: hypothetical protein EPO24_06190 [Bacteroidetes bacterium]|nr:MAG: hypothetical protein EPO24_06190 [Bacteroidota bacterium]